MLRLERNAEMNADVPLAGHTVDVLVCFSSAVLFHYCKALSWLVICN